MCCSVVFCGCSTHARCSEYLFTIRSHNQHIFFFFQDRSDKQKNLSTTFAVTNVDYMQRQKTQEEIDQERRDEEFARQLQEELNAAPPPAPSRPPAQHVSPPQQNSVATVQQLCPYCSAVNHLPREAPAGQSFRCGSCTQMLPGRRPTGGAAIPGPAPGLSHITCQNCRCINQVPVGATTQFMCGSCHRLLSFNASPQTIAADQRLGQRGYPVSMSQGGASPPPQQPMPAAAPGPIYEGRVARTIQVRCGQCQTVNTVKATGSSVEFVCTQCQSTNEVDL